ncbi:MAG: hypothetical protein D6714_19850 [Bacteroidetes bacterium]|nr:MAG: hypothetical protein D6714_19850 [Bacteroidota bacterium]
MLQNNILGTTTCPHRTPCQVVFLCRFVTTGHFRAFFDELTDCHFGAQGIKNADPVPVFSKQGR